jgi:hypothetical protein
MSEAKSIKFDVTTEEANYILISLSQRPYNEVAALLMKLKAQADAQVKSEN